MSSLAHAPTTRRPAPESVDAGHMPDTKLPSGPRVSNRRLLREMYDSSDTGTYSWPASAVAVAVAVRCSVASVRATAGNRASPVYAHVEPSRAMTVDT